MIAKNVQPFLLGGRVRLHLSCVICVTVSGIERAGPLNSQKTYLDGKKKYLWINLNTMKNMINLTY